MKYSEVPLCCVKHVRSETLHLRSKVPHLGPRHRNWFGMDRHTGNRYNNCKFSRVHSSPRHPSCSHRSYWRRRSFHRQQNQGFYNTGCSRLGVAHLGLGIGTVHPHPAGSAKGWCRYHNNHHRPSYSRSCYFVRRKTCPPSKHSRHTCHCTLASCSSGSLHLQRLQNL